jgi:hypothetical protein
MMSDLPLKNEDSLNADGDGSSNGDGIGDVCRDFLRNVCRRGNTCRFRHPDPSEAEELGKKIEYIFCHDYQNRECRRQNCRFLHCTKQEEEVYRSTGKLPQHVLDKMAANKASEMAAANVPICKDNLKGECRRGPGRCKFRHVSQNDYELEMRGNNHNIHHSRFEGHSSRNAMHNVFNDHGFDSFAPPEPKRRAYDTQTFSATNFGGFAAERNSLGLGGLTSAAAQSLADFEYNASTAALHTTASLPNTIYSSARYLEEENAALRRRIDELKKQVADLMATNEFLLEQNAQLRTMGKAGQAQAQASAPPLAPPPLPQLSSDLMGQQRATDLGVGVVPASLGMQAQTMSGLPVSSIASMSLPTSVSLSNSAPLVSYPIITTQSMRPAVMTHSLVNH